MENKFITKKEAFRDVFEEINKALDLPSMYGLLRSECSNVDFIIGALSVHHEIKNRIIKLEKIFCTKVTLNSSLPFTSLSNIDREKMDAWRHASTK